MDDDDYKRWLKFFVDKSDKIIVDQGGDGEDCDVLICRLKTEPLLFPDNLIGPCSKCFRLVQFRPRAPKRPPRMCDECAAKNMAAALARGEKVHTTITQKSARDAADYIRKKKMN